VLRVRECPTVAAAAVLLAAAHPALAMSPAVLRRTLRARPLRLRVLPALSPERAAAVVRGVAARLPCRPSCLEQAAALVWILAAQGTAAHMAIGVRREGGGLAAHAWVERDGRVLLGDPSSAGFAPLATRIDPCRA